MHVFGTHPSAPEYLAVCTPSNQKENECHSCKITVQLFVQKALSMANKQCISWWKKEPDPLLQPLKSKLEKPLSTV
jgi:hypothetical protein